MALIVLHLLQHTCSNIFCEFQAEKGINAEPRSVCRRAAERVPVRVRLAVDAWSTAAFPSAFAGTGRR